MRHAFATTALAAVLGTFGAAAAYAGVGDGILGADVGQARIAPVENAQFFFGGQNYCWYDSGWRGPGWYWCGYAWRSGYGWGGGVGFHGWTRPNGPPRRPRPTVMPHPGVVRGPMHVMPPKGPTGGHPGPKGPTGGAPGPEKRIP
jgi:hypothetical protein